MLLSMVAYFNSLKIESNILPYRAGQGVDAVKYCAVVNSDGKVYHFPANCLEITEVTTVSVDGEDEKQRDEAPQDGMCRCFGIDR